MTTYTDYPFTAQGINFISRVVTDSSMGIKISQIPQTVFSQMNIDAVKEIIGDVTRLNREELISELERINAGGTQAFIVLGENN